MFLSGVEKVSLSRMLLKFNSSPNVMTLNGNTVDVVDGTISGISSSKFISAHNLSISSGDKFSG